MFTFDAREHVPGHRAEYKTACTQRTGAFYLGTNNVPQFWLGYLRKGCVHISAKRESYSGTVPGNLV